MSEAEGATEGPFPIDPRDLVRHARALVQSLPERSATDYRRAVSAAYYALFHALTLRTVEALAPDVAPRARYEQVREFGHPDLRRAALWASGAGVPSRSRAALVARARADGEVRRVAEAFLRLNAERADADYNHLAHFAEPRALRLIDTADEAVETVTAPAFAAADGGMAFLRLLAAMPDAP